MKNESESFGRGDLVRFLDDLVDRDRRSLIRRLRAASRRLARAKARLGLARATSQGQWSAHEVLAHIAVLSKFYGVVTYEVASGRMPNVDLLHNIRLRDSTGIRLLENSDEQLVDVALLDHRRTISFLQKALPGMLRHRAIVRGVGSMSAEEICRLSLCTHLEQHLDQLEALLK